MRSFNNRQFLTAREGGRERNAAASTNETLLGGSMDIRLGHRLEDIPLRSVHSRPLAPERVFERAVCGPGSPLPHRATLERAFGQTLSGVKSYLGRADDLKAVGAEAATKDERIVFASSDPSVPTVAHEVAHVLQNRHANQSGNGYARPSVSDPDAASELEAERVASQVTNGLGAPGLIRPDATPGGTVQFVRDQKRPLPPLATDFIPGAEQNPSDQKRPLPPLATDYIREAEQNPSGDVPSNQAHELEISISNKRANNGSGARPVRWWNELWNRWRNIICNRSPAHAACAS